VAQVVQHLPSKCEALSSNPNNTKKKKKGDRYRIIHRQKLGALEHQQNLDIEELCGLDSESNFVFSFFIF
jgi:hypothetical protein